MLQRSLLYEIDFKFKRLDFLLVYKYEYKKEF